ncbi:MAG: sigma-54 dependent transcriptional regulator [Thermodesulfobacteriota bacterium]
MNLKILVLDDDHVFRKNLCKAIVGRGHEVWAAEKPSDALRLASELSFDAAFIDMNMPEMNGIETLKELKELQPSVMGIILTGYGSIPDAVTAIKTGGYHYLTKPTDMAEIEKILKTAAEEKSHGEISQDSGNCYHEIIGRSPAIRRVINLVRKVKEASVPVLITGESGSGKELVARAIHFDSGRKANQFIAINCASLKPELLENELFGHVKGAFSGATEFKDGLVKLADRGTLFIDEIADMNPMVQASLLRFIESGLYRPLGSNKEVKVNVRIVAAMNRIPEEEVLGKRFREDLYFRLNVCRIHIPPLRERREDITLIAQRLLAKLSDDSGRHISFSKDATDCLRAHNWPGNVRELSHVIQRLVLLNAGKDAITADMVSRAINQSAGPERFLKSLLKTPGLLDESEKAAIHSSLDANGWNISRTANVLGIDRRTLQRKITRYGIRARLR